MKKVQVPLLILLFVMLSQGCNKNPDDNSINLFSVEDDIELGRQLSDEIAANPQEYPVLDPVQYAEAYNHLERIKNTILNAGNVFYADKFDWEMKIIQNDSVLNAFAAPGGYIYVYTGLIKYLETEDHFAGVLAHEIAHADRRHSTDQLTKLYGLQLMLDVVLGRNSGAISNIAASLVSLKFSRDNESEADEYSVIYLCDTEYLADGAAGFFQKLESDGQSPGIPEFLSTHPSPDKRVENIQLKEQELACTGTEAEGDYQAFKASLP